MGDAQARVVTALVSIIGQVDTSAVTGGGASMSLSVGETGRTKADGGKRSRRSYSDEEKRRIVAEAC